MDVSNHLHHEHLPALLPGIEAFKALKPLHSKDEAMLTLSIYNEGVATAVRRGAPLASYSIDRRCMPQYNTHLKHDNTGASYVFCAHVGSHECMEPSIIQLSFFHC